MNRSKIRKLIELSLRQEFKIKQTIFPQLKISELNIDSLDLMLFIIKMEQKWKLKIPDKQLVKILTIDNLIEEIYRAKQQKKHEK